MKCIKNLRDKKMSLQFIEVVCYKHVIYQEDDQLPEISCQCGWVISPGRDSITQC